MILLCKIRIYHGAGTLLTLLGNDDIPTDVFEEDDTISVDLTGVLQDVDGSEVITSYLLGPLPQVQPSMQGPITVMTLGRLHQVNWWATDIGTDSDDFLLEVQAISEETDPDSGAVSNNVALSSLMIEINPIAENISLTTSDVSGQQNAPIDLDINASIPDQDGSETLSIIISGVPAGVTLSAGTDNGDGSYTLTVDQLSGLQPPPMMSPLPCQLMLPALT